MRAGTPSTGSCTFHKALAKNLIDYSHRSAVFNVPLQGRDRCGKAKLVMILDHRYLCLVGVHNPCCLVSQERGELKCHPNGSQRKFRYCTIRTHVEPLAMNLCYSKVSGTGSVGAGEIFTVYLGFMWWCKG